MVQVRASKLKFDESTAQYHAMRYTLAIFGLGLAFGSRDVCQGLETVYVECSKLQLVHGYIPTVRVYSCISWSGLSLSRHPGNAIKIIFC